MRHALLPFALLSLAACAPDAPPAPDGGTPEATASAAQNDAHATDASNAPTPAGEADAADAVPPAALAPVRADVGDGMGELRYFGRTIDLDGDARSEAVVQVIGPGVCGSGGCTTYVLSQDGAGAWVIASRLSVSRQPVAAATSRTNGWRDLLVSVGGGGGQAGLATVRFDGAAYPSNPTTVPGPTLDALPADAEVLVPAFESFQEGIVLP